MLYQKEKKSFDLTIEILCNKYHKLPSEVLNEDFEWILKLFEIHKIYSRREDLESKRRELKSDK